MLAHLSLFLSPFAAKAHRIQNIGTRFVGQANDVHYYHYTDIDMLTWNAHWRNRKKIWFLFSQMIYLNLVTLEAVSRFEKPTLILLIAFQQIGSGSVHERHERNGTCNGNEWDGHKEHQEHQAHDEQRKIVTMQIARNETFCRLLDIKMFQCKHIHATGRTKNSFLIHAKLSFGFHLSCRNGFFKCAIFDSILYCTTKSITIKCKKKAGTTTKSVQPKEWQMEWRFKTRIPKNFSHCPNAICDYIEVLTVAFSVDSVLELRTVVTVITYFI